MATLKDIRLSITELPGVLEVMEVIQPTRYKRQIPGATNPKTAKRSNVRKKEENKALAAIKSLSQEELAEILRKVQDNG